MAAAPYSTGDPTSFAYPTARERWPIIIVSLPLHHSVNSKDKTPC